MPESGRERQLADSVLQVAVSANYETFEILKKEDPIMCDALRELMKPEMDEALNKAVTTAVATAVADTTEKMDIENIGKLMSNMGLSVDQAMDALDIASNSVLFFGIHRGSLREA